MQDLIPQMEEALPFGTKTRGRSRYLKADYDRLAHRLRLPGGFFGCLNGCLTQGWSGEMGSRGSTAPNCSTIGTLLLLPPLFGSRGHSLLGIRSSDNLTSQGLRSWKPTV